jgi:hypoxanthine phosphoribosyltransferase
METIKGKQFVRLIGKQALDLRITELARILDEEYREKNPVFIGVLNGSFIFLAEIFKQLTIPCEVSFVKVKSYEGTKSSGQVRELIGLSEDIEDRAVILVEDIIDTGTTVGELLPDLLKQKPSSLKILTLLFKKKAFKAGYAIDYVGFEIEDRFVVGFGLDYDGFGRNYPEILVAQNNS